MKKAVCRVTPDCFFHVCLPCPAVFPPGGEGFFFSARGRVGRKETEALQERGALAAEMRSAS